MSYPVLYDFIEKNHENTFYKQGEQYPKDGFKEEPKRVAFLQKKHYKYRVAFLGKAVPDKETPDETPDTPEVDTPNDDPDSGENGAK
jgi:hypothetical protein